MSMSRVEILAIDQALQYSDLLIADDCEFVETLSADRRRREVVAWRSLLRWMLSEMGADARLPVKYDIVGAPYLVGSALFISVSHSSTHVAIVISESKCAVDIESLDRNFESVASRYATASERTLLQNSDIAPTLHLPLIWSAKEAMYKLSGRQGLDLLKDLIIEEVSPSHIASMSWFVCENHIVVYGV